MTHEFVLSLPGTIPASACVKHDAAAPRSACTKGLPHPAVPFYSLLQRGRTKGEKPFLSRRAESLVISKWVFPHLARSASTALPGLLIACLCCFLLAGKAGAADYCVSSSHGLDSNTGACPSSPWQTIAKVVSEEGTFKAGDTIRFLAGDVWNEELTLNNIHGAAGSPITFTSYTGNGQTGRPVIDGCSASGCTGNNRNSLISACVAADQSTGTGNGVSYISIGSTTGGFECRNTSDYGIDFRVENTAMRGIVIQNNYIHHTGPGASAGSPFDDGHYRNQLNAEDDTSGRSGGDSFQILNNIVNHCGGHNCLQVHFDTGAPIVKGNTVGPGCVHNCIDAKGVGNSGSPAQILNNYVTCPGCSSGVAAYYTENIANPSENITYQNNVAYDAPVGFQAETGGSCHSASGTCAINARYYNNTTYKLSQFSFIDSSCSTHTLDFEKNIMDTGAIDIHTGSCASVTWNSNDGWNVSGALSGTNNISADPLFCGESASVNNFAKVSNFSPYNSAVGTTAAYMGAVAPGLPCDGAGLQAPNASPAASPTSSKTRIPPISSSEPTPWSRAPAFQTSGTAHLAKTDDPD